MKKLSKKSLKDFQNGQKVQTILKSQQVKVKGGIVVEDINGL